MLLEKPVVHLIGKSRIPLHSVLAHELGDVARLTFWDSGSDRLAFNHGDTVVVDLLDGGPRVKNSALSAIASHQQVWLVIGEAPVLPVWVDLAAQAGIRLARTAPGSEIVRLKPILASIERQLCGPSAEELLAGLLERQPHLIGVARLVRVILERPWDIRHPTQLAARSGTSMRKLKQACLALGFRRTEHFMVAVRQCAASQLVNEGLRPARARRLAGISDTANFRRQLRRAQRGSGDGFRRVPDQGLSVATSTDPNQLGERDLIQRMGPRFVP